MPKRFDRYTALNQPECREIRVYGAAFTAQLTTGLTRVGRLDRVKKASPVIRESTMCKDGRDLSCGRPNWHGPCEFSHGYANKGSERRPVMPEKRTIERARRDKEEGKSPSTQAGEFVREEIEHVRKGIHGARSTKQAIAIGLSKARRAGVELAPPRAGTTSAATRRQAARDSRRGRTRVHRPSTTRANGTCRALKREGHSAGSREALSRQARGAAARRTKASRSEAARRAAATKAHERTVRGRRTR